jgi:restriction system protein
MPIPTFQQIMLPLLEVFKGGQIFHIKDTENILAEVFQLDKEEILQTYSKTNQTKIFLDRIGWAKIFLKKAYLLEQVERGKYKITKRGLELLATKPTEINVKLLKTYSDFWDKNTKKVKLQNSNLEIGQNLTQTPDELIENSYLETRELLKSEIKDKIITCSPQFFEKLVLELLIKMGYGGDLEEAGEVTKYTNDGGIDGIIKEDRLGLDKIYIQAKRWQANVGRDELQKFVGAMSGTQKGVFITTSFFNKNALEYIKTRPEKIVLVDGDILTDLMIDYDLGVSLKKAYLLKKVDNDYFEEF